MFAHLKVACSQPCKDWGAKDYSTVRIDLAAIRPLDCNDDSNCPCNDVIESLQSADKELVTDQENVPPNGFKAPRLNPPSQNDEILTPISTAASTTGSVKSNDKDLRVPRLNLLEASHEKGAEQYLAQKNAQDVKQEHVTDQAHQLLAGEFVPQSHPKATAKGQQNEKDGVAFELKVTRMGWDERQCNLVRGEEVVIPSDNELHLLVDLTVADIKALIKQQNVTLRSGEVLNMDDMDMVLTTPGKLTVGEALHDEKTLAGSGVSAKGPDLLFLDMESMRKASGTGGPGTEEQKMVEAKLYFKEKARKQQELDSQRKTVESWLKRAGFKDVNELVRKRLKKTRPLHVAVQSGDAEMVRLLLLMGADPQMCNGKKEKPLSLATRIARNEPTATHLKVATVLSHWSKNLENSKKECSILLG